MFWDDILLVTEQIEKYGLRKPFVDLGGLEKPCIADYELTIKTGNQNARYLFLNQRPFDHIDMDYRIINPENGDPCIEQLPDIYYEMFGTAICLNVIEHVENPFQVYSALYNIMKNNCLLIIETVFSFPYHPGPIDYWRYSPDCLRYIAELTGFKVLECDWRLFYASDAGILNSQNGKSQEISSVYIVLTKGNFTIYPQDKYSLPERYSTTTGDEIE